MKMINNINLRSKEFRRRLMRDKRQVVSIVNVRLYVINMLLFVVNI